MGEQMKAHSLGGQAVIEGVMMRSLGWWALAVRRPEGGIHIESHETGGISKRRPWLGKPFLRGVIGLGETLSIGVRALSTSARISAGEEDPPSRKEIVGALAGGFAFFVLLFIVLPAILSRGGEGSSGVLQNLKEGGIRIGILVAYILLLSRVKDIRRVFEYHGAEHKVIAAYEAGSPTTPDGARPFSTIHVRCGTDFLFLVMIMAVLVFSLVPRGSILLRVGSRIGLLPVVAALSYEILRLAARFERNPLVRALTWPGRLFQHITTKEPADDQLEVAVASLKELLGREGLPERTGDLQPPAA